MSLHLFISTGELQRLLQLHFLDIELHHYSAHESANVLINCRALHTDGNRTLLFKSQLLQIELPNDEAIPQYKVLYGIPAGLLSHRNEASVETAVLTSDYAAPTNDKLYAHLRRALLFHQVWLVKNMETYEAKKQLLFLLDNHLTRDFLMLLVENFLQSDSFPQHKPAQVSIDSSIYEFQINWLGRTLGEHLLEGRRMNDDEKKWFLNCFRVAPEDTPVVFQPLATVIVGYLLHLNGFNQGRNSFTDLNRLLDTTSYCNHYNRAQVLSAAVFFAGLTTGKADNYFMVSGAASLFYSIEKLAWQLAQNTPDFIVEVDGHSQIINALMQPVENCVNYYKFKNPGIATMEFFEYSGGKTDLFPAKIPVLKEKEVQEFLKKNQFVTFFPSLFENSLLLFSNRFWYQKMRNLLPDKTFLWEKGAISGNAFHVNLKTNTLCVDNPHLRKWLVSKGCKAIEFSDLLPKLRDEWVLMTGNFELSATSQDLLRLLSANCELKRIYVFNFNNRKQSAAPSLLFDYNEEDTSTAKKKKKAPKYFNDVEQRSSATLKRDILNLFDGCDVHIVSMNQHEAPWEMVNLGIGVLQHTRFSSCSIIETRLREAVRSSDYPTLVRCFSDIIVYVPEMKYQFLNL